ncbi:RNA polymerase sporulation sigma factor SigF [Clostridiales bacterium NSJ-32]|jgi:RNA polymerase sigma-F factor|uniref:RNA polymerase sigma factor n=1 Tax=Bianquea renquensis TaxID=2763661 RepID=A0A926DR62_9FIRM|nr:RNA polymerase sporulation sigma factor SigF [Bianquea renquensis]
MDRTLELIKKARSGDHTARDLIVEENVGLVWSIVKRFTGRGYEMEDLFQIGSIGLIKAVDKFDFSFETKFSTYAIPMIIGEIKRFLRDDGMIKVSRTLKELSIKIHQTREVLESQLHRPPTLQELSDEMGVSPEEITLALESGVPVESLYTTIHEGDGSPVYLIDKVHDGGDGEEDMIETISLRNYIRQLDPKEQQIITMRYYDDKTQAEVAKIIGISQVQVSRLEKKILGKMREKLGS